MKFCFIGNAGHINLLGWAKNLARLPDLEIDILTFDKPCEQTDEVRIHILKGPLTNTKARSFLTIPQVKKNVQLISPDILIGYRVNTYGLMAVNTRFHPVVVIAQGSDIFFPTRKIIKKTVVKYVLQKADLIHTWASHMGDKLVEYGASRENMLILPKGVDTSLFKPSNNRTPRETFNLISTRQLRKTYNHECILGALPLAIQEIPNLQYLICGEGEYKSELENLVKKLAIGNHAKFTGRIEHNTLPFYLSNSEIYLSMQSSDGVSGSLLEAMACGVFPIVVDNEANRLWIKHGFNGFLIPIGDDITLANKIIEAYHDNELRKRAKKINVQLINTKASMEHNTKMAMKIYSGLMEKTKSRILI